MGEFTPEQQHAFCRFVTGAPRLPPGGLAALNPKLTIVRKVMQDKCLMLWKVLIVLLIHNCTFVPAFRSILRLRQILQRMGLEHLKQLMTTCLVL